MNGPIETCEPKLPKLIGRRDSGIFNISKAASKALKLLILDVVWLLGKYEVRLMPY